MIIVSVHAFLIVGHVKASNMVSPSLAVVFMGKVFRVLLAISTLQQGGDVGMSSSQPHFTIYTLKSSNFSGNSRKSHFLIVIYMGGRP